MVKNNRKIVSWKLARTLVERGIITPAKMYYKIDTPTGEHEPEFSKRLILHAWGTKEIPLDVFIPAPTIDELEEYVDYKGIVLDDELLETIKRESE